MPAGALDFPVFDADNHLYETREAFTRHLPDALPGRDRLRRGRGRTKIAVRGQISEYIPNPTFDVVARPGAPGGLLPRTATPRASRCRELFGEPIGVAGVPRAGAAPRAHGRAGHRPDAHVPDARQPARGADARRPRADPRGDPLAQRVAARDLDVQLPGPHLHHAGDHPAHRRARRSRSSSGCSSGAPGSC